jgi:hypothetical protein
VDEFALSYKAYCQLPYGFGATLTAFNLDNVHQLLSEIKELTVKLYKAVKVKTNRYRILDLRTRTFSLLSSDNLDFYDFMKGLSTLQLGDSEIQKSAQQLAKTMKKAMLAHWAGGRVYYRASGLSITLANWMGDYDLRKYQLLKWSKFSKWDKFMKRVWR